MSIHDLIEVGRFGAALRGEHAYGFTPHFWLDRKMRSLRWLCYGLWHWVRVCVRGPYGR